MGQYRKLLTCSGLVMLCGAVTSASCGGSDTLPPLCPPSIAKPAAGVVVAVDDADLVLQLQSCTTLADFTVMLNSEDITRYFVEQDGSAAASLWDTELSDLSATDNALVVLDSAKRTVAQVTFSVQTDRLMLIRDEWNIPHVFAFSKQAGFFGMGWAAADEYGEELVTKAYRISGRGAELNGISDVANDYSRRLYQTYEKVDESYQQIDAETRTVTEAYAKGINAYHLAHPSKPPVPEINAKMIIAAARAPDTNRAHQVAAWELGYGVMIDNMGEDLWRKLHPPVTGAPVIRKTDLGSGGGWKKTPEGSGAPPVPLSEATMAEYAKRLDAEEHEGDGPTNGSFTWVVLPEKSATGNTLVGGVFAFPEHTPTSEMHIKCPEYDAIGLLGGPALFFGHNRHLTWWTTRTNPDTGDVYTHEVKVNSKGYPTQYLHGGVWREVVKVALPIKYKANNGGELLNAPLPAFYTQQGLPFELLDVVDDRPVVSEKVGSKHYSWAVNLADFHDAEQITPSILQMKAKGFEELTDYLQPRHNTIFTTTSADRNGDVFFLFNGKVPTRADETIDEWSVSGHWLRPFDGSSGEGQWTGYVPFEQLPRFDSRLHGRPDEGFLLNMGAGSNIWVPREEIASYPRGLFEYQLVDGQDPAATFTGNGWYFAALDFDERLQALDEVTVDDMKQLAFSTHCPIVKWYREVLLGAYDNKKHLLSSGVKAEAEQVIAVLRNSSNYADEDNRGILMWHTWLDKLVDEVFADELGGNYDAFMNTLQPAKHGKIHFLLSLIYLPELGMSPVDVSYLQQFVDRKDTKEVEDRDTIAVRALEAAIRDIIDDPEKKAAFGGTTPRWGDVFEEDYQGKVFERFGAPRTLGCVEEKDDYLLSGLGANGQKGKYRTLYKVVWELGEDGIAAQTIVARNQGIKAPGDANFFDQGELYQQRQMKQSLYYYRDVLPSERSRQLIDVE